MLMGIISLVHSQFMIGYFISPDIPAVGQPWCKAAKISKIFQISLRSLPIALLETSPFLFVDT